MPSVIVEKRNGILYLTLNRPQVKNAMDPEAFVQLHDAWIEYRDNPELRCAIITGAGEEAFSSGADLKTLVPLLTKAKAPETDWDRRFISDRKIGQVAFLHEFELWKPVIAAINGLALGGGTEIMHSTDIRLAVPEATFGLSEVKRALFPGASVARLPRHIPYVKAMEIMLVGDPITAAEAHRIGLINEVVPRGRLMDRAEEFARKIAENGPVSVQRIKEGVIRSSGVPLEEAYRIEHEMAKVVGRTEDAREGPRAFAEKRKPEYKGQ